MKEFRINKTKFYAYLIANVILILLFLGLLILFWVDKNENDDTFSIFLLSLIFGGLAVVCAIHPTYCIISQYRYEQDVVFTIDKKNKECIYQKRKKSIRFKPNDVKFVFSNSTFWGAGLPRHAMGWYIEILLKSGKSIYLSSLLGVDDKYLARVLKTEVTYQSASTSMAFPIDELWMIGIKDNDLIDERI